MNRQSDDIFRDNKRRQDKDFETSGSIVDTIHESNIHINGESKKENKKETEVAEIVDTESTSGASSTSATEDNKVCLKSNPGSSPSKWRRRDSTISAKYVGLNTSDHSVKILEEYWKCGSENCF